MAKLPANQVDAFLEELTTLTRKYGIEIKACGCCGSPFLLDANDHNFKVKDIMTARYTVSDGEFDCLSFGDQP